MFFYIIHRKICGSIGCDDKMIHWKPHFCSVKALCLTCGADEKRFVQSPNAALQRGHKSLTAIIYEIEAKGKLKLLFCQNVTKIKKDVYKCKNRQYDKCIFYQIHIFYMCFMGAEGSSIVSRNFMSRAIRMRRAGACEDA